MVRSMISEKKILKSFWPEAINWTVHVLNRSPTLAVKNKTPEEAWSGVKPSVEHFRVLGCISHVHVPDSKRTKLDDKSLSCVLLGVSEELKAYKLCDPTSQRIIISRDVVFKEDKSWDWDKTYEEFVMCDLEWGEQEEAADVFDENEEGSEFDIEAAEENTAEENISSGSLAEASSPSLAEASSPSLAEASFPSSNKGRNRRPPVWMRDYATGEDLLEEDNEAHLAMFITTDPVNFEYPLKSEKWRQVMDLEMEAISHGSEMEAINRNGT